MSERVRTVLIVEDDHDLRDSMRLVCEADGLRAESAANGLEAIERLQAMAPPDVILLDLMMPVMNGWQLHAWLVAQGPPLARVPVLLLSAVADLDAAGRELRAAGHVAKPITRAKLMAALERVFAGR